MKLWFSAAALALVGLVSVPAQAALTTYDLTYSGSSFGNSAIGTGSITLDTSVVTNPGITDQVGTPFVTAFSLTITGASVGNGTFGMADYGDFLLDTNNGTLNLAQELIGQPTAGNPFGSTLGNAGNFNVFLNGFDPTAPGAVAPFTISTNGGGGDELFLTSFAPASTAAPEPGSLALLGMTALPLIGIVRRRKA